MKNVEPSMAFRQCIGGRELLRLVHNFRKIADTYLNPPLLVVSLEIRPIQGGCSLRYCLAIFGETQCVCQLEIPEDGDGDRESFRLHPIQGLGGVDVVSIEREKETCIRTSHHFPPASLRISRDSFAGIIRNADRSRSTAGLCVQSTRCKISGLSGTSRAITFPLRVMTTSSPALIQPRRLV